MGTATGTPGWYPDPAGAPHTLRYWDGRAWTEQLRPARPGPEHLTAPSSPPRPAVPAGPPPRPPRRSLPVGALVAIAVVLVLALLAWFLTRPEGGSPGSRDSSSPTVSAWDERSPSPNPSTTLAPCATQADERRPHPEDGRLHGGGLVVEVAAGFTAGGDGFGWVIGDRAAALKRVPGSTWTSFTQIGRLSRERFPDAARAPGQVIACHTSSPNFPGRTDVTTLAQDQPRVSGRPAWRLRQQVGSGSAPGGGSVFDVTVVDVGDGDWWGVYWSGVVKQDEAALTDVEAARATLALDR